MKALAFGLTGWLVALGLWAFTASAQSPSPLYVNCVTTTPPRPASATTINPVFQTATALAFPTPSQEVLNRYQVVAPNGMNVRAAPATTAPVTGYLLFGQVVEIGQVVMVGGITWGRVPSGFVALDGNGQVFLRSIQ
jgi:hypothetical protein